MMLMGPGGGATATIWGDAQFWEDLFCGERERMLHLLHSCTLCRCQTMEDPP